MHLPIRYALGDASRMASQRPGLTLSDYATLTFERPDYDRFPCLTLASLALKEKGTTACVINAANEVAVAAFLNGRIRFTSIFPLIQETLARAPYVATPTYEDYVATNAESRTIAGELVGTGRY